VPDAEPQEPTSRFAWLGTVKGVLAIIASLIAITGGILGIVKWFNDRQGMPSFEGSVTTRDQARDLVSFLNDHDGEVVKLDVSCGPYREMSRPDSGCNGNLGPEDAPVIPRDGEQVAAMELFTKTTCPADDARARCDGTYWTVMRVGADDDEQVDNGSFGAGGLVVKGVFKALVRGAIGSAPPGVQVVELDATD
jgi:hypothetical protein